MARHNNIEWIHLLDVVYYLGALSTLEYESGVAAFPWIMMNNNIAYPDPVNRGQNEKPQTDYFFQFLEVR